MNNFLQTRQQVDNCTNYLKNNNLLCHGLSCKDYDLAEVVPLLKDGDLLDMGSQGSSILDNVVRRNLTGLKYGIDLSYPENSSSGGIGLFKGDLMNCPFQDGMFNTITCMSVIEHEVDFNLLGKECARLLKPGGELFMTFDYWDPKVDTSWFKMFGLSWTILDRADVARLIKSLEDHGLYPSGPIDYNTTEPVINPSYCSPTSVSYTFGSIHFIKQ